MGNRARGAWPQQVGQLVHYEILLAPVPAARPKVGRWSTYYPARYQAWKDAAPQFITPLPAQVLDEPVGLVLEIVCKRPKKITRSTPVGDIDNLTKAVMDAITAAGVWTDDDLVAELQVIKRYAAVGEVPRTVAHIKLLH